MNTIKASFNKPINATGWSPESINADLSAKVIAVTGGNAGLGYQTVLELAKHSPKRIFLAARTQTKFDDALDKITQQVPNAKDFISFVEMDLSSLASVKQAAGTITSATDRLDILFNNAGIMGAPIKLTTEGYENHFGTNHMGHALLTKLLLPLLLRTAEQPGSDVRIINVSSMGHQMAPSGKINPALVTTDMKDAAMMARYGQSKLANVVHARSLAQKYPGIVSVSVHPGRVATGLLDDMYSTGRHGFFGQFQKVYDIIVGPMTPEMGAWTQLWCATVPKTNLKSGGYYIPIGHLDAGSKTSQDQNVADALWEWQEGEFAKLGYA